MVKANLQSNKARNILLAILPGLVVAGFVFAINTYYDFDLRRIITWDDQEFKSTVYLGVMEFAEDRGAISWINMPVSASPATGTVMSYTAQIDSQNILTVYAEADGTGGIQNSRVGIGTTTPAYKLDVNGTLRVTGTSTLGVIDAGTWQGTPIATQYGGTGQDWSTISQGSLPYFSATGTMATLAPGISGYFLKTQGEGQDPVWVEVPIGEGKLPSGIAGQTLRHDGTNWVVTSNLYHDGTKVGIGTTTPAAILDVWATSSATALSVTQDGDGNIVEFKIGSDSKFVINNSGEITTGTWKGTPIGTQYGGTGIDTSATTGIPYISSGIWSAIATGTEGYYLKQGATQPEWAAIAGGVGGSGVATRIAFWSDTNILSSDADLYWDNTDKHLGIGTTTPATTLGVYGTSTFMGGNVGIGTTTPAYKLDVDGNLRASLSLTVGINVQTLSGDITLTPGIDKMYQYLNPGTSDRIITLATTTADVGDRFIIRHNGVHDNTRYLDIRQGATTLDYIYAGAIKEFVFNGISWISGGIGTGEAGNEKYNIAIGYGAQGYTVGTAVGSNAKGHSYGVAVGRSAQGYSSGVAVGWSAEGHSSGAAVGYYTLGYSSGAAVGSYAFGFSSGAAVGYLARGMKQGVAIGYRAGANIDTVGNRGNIVIGYQAGDNITTGNKNIIIGYDIDAPSTTISNFLSLGNLIFATGIDGTGTTISSGNVGIGTTTPAYLLTVDTGSTSTYGIAVEGSIKASGSIVSDVSLDIAERFSIDPRCKGDGTCPETGDLVSIKENVIIEKSSVPYDPKLIGVVSGIPAITMGGGLDATSSLPVALVGRLPVKVSIENGPIAIGDLLTSVSSIPGTAMKSTKPGRVIGVALEPYNSEDIGKIMVFVNPHWSIGSLSEDGLFDIDGERDGSIKQEQRGILDQFTLAVKNSLKKLGLLVENGIAKVKELFAEKITVGQLCLEDDDGEEVCLTKNQLKELLMKNGTQNVNKSGGSGGGGGNVLTPTTTLPTTTSTTTLTTTSTTTPSATTTPTSTDVALPTCTPNWQCIEWQPEIDESLCGQTIKQTRICTDTNNCGTEEEKPAETQEVEGPECPEIIDNDDDY